MPPDTRNPSIQEIYAALVVDERRNNLIFDDLLLALEAGRSPLLLTERTEHVDYFAKRLKGFARNVIVLRGGMGKKQRLKGYKAIGYRVRGRKRFYWQKKNTKTFGWDKQLFSISYLAGLSRETGEV